MHPHEEHLTAQSIAEIRTNVIAQAAQYAAEYLAGVDTRSVAPSAEPSASLAELCGELPANAAAPETVVELLHRLGSPATVVNSGGRYFGFVNGGAVPASLGAAILVNAWGPERCLSHPVANGSRP